MSGTVKDANGNAIVGATVIVDGTTIGTNTGTDGSFRISAPANGNLLVSFIGYEDQKIAIAGKTNIEVVLQDNYTAIEGVTVQTFGELKKKDLTGSITAVTAKDLQKMTVSSVANALEGAVPGIQSYSTTGQPGTDAAIYIRGIGSINGNQAALIVVDGVPYSSALSSINPLDIESVVVSKDAAANALYGSRAANGVVFVTTKKGARNQKANITFEAKWGWNEMGVGEHETMQNPGDYYEWTYAGLYNYFAVNNPGVSHDALANAAYRNLFPMTGNYMAYKLPDGETLIDFATGKINPNAQLLYADNYDDYLFTKQFRQEYTLSISGGNDKVDYYVSGNFLDDPSYVIMSSFKRYSGRAAVNAQVTNWMKLGTNVSYSRRDTDDPGFGDGANTGNVFMWTQWQAPVVPFYARDLDGNIRYNPDGTMMYENGGGRTLSPYGETYDMFNALNNYANPMESMSRDVNNMIRDNIYANAYVDITFLKDFKFTANFTLDNVYNYTTYFQNNEYGYGTSLNGFVQKSVSHYNSYNTQQMLNYKKSINDLHNVDVMIGHEFNKTDNNSLAAYKTNIFYPGVPELGNAVSAYLDSSTSERVITSLEGYFARANYNYDDRYFLSLRIVTTDRRASSTTSGATSGLSAVHGASLRRSS
ncbi:MAG: SusC/RagA family TonB-linked outer membrane protein [Bacteroidales bacterium]|nr:MAG: SusC/RagA family TonB-linked outer membrane protein [Bacteroidales bacterium]